MVMMAEFGLHYFPYKLLLRGKALPRVIAYTLGVTGIMSPFTAWLWYRGDFEIIQTLWAAIISGGLIVLSLHGLDHYLDLEMRDLESTERETNTRSRRDVKK